MTNDKAVYINQLKDHVGQEVTLQGWLYNSRPSGKVQFLIVRDGTGLCQCVVEKAKDAGRAFEQLSAWGRSPRWPSPGIVRDEPRSPGGYEWLSPAPRSICPDGRLSRSPPSSTASTSCMRNRHLHLAANGPGASAGPPHGHRRHPPLFQRQRLYPGRYADLHDHRPARGPDAVRGRLLRPAAAPGPDRPALSRIGRMAYGQVYCFGPTFRAEKAKPAGT